MKNNYNIPKLSGRTNLIKRVFILFMLFSLSIVGTTFAQDFDNGDFRVTYSPEDLGVGGGAANSDNIITVQAIKATLHSFEITMQLPPGVSYEAGTVAFVSGAAYDVAEANIDNLQNPVFSIINGATTTPWDIGASVLFSFTRTANCDAVTYKEGGGTFKDNAKIDYVDINSGTESDVDGDATTGTYDVLSSSVAIESMMGVDGVVGGTHVRDVKDINGGNAGHVTGQHLVTLGESIIDYHLFYGATEIPQAAGSTVTDLIFDYDMSTAPFNIPTADEDGDGLFSGGEKLVFREEFGLADCVSTSIIHSTAWECQTSQPVAGAVLFGAESPNLGIVVDENHNNVCGVNHVRLTITNNGVGDAAWAKDVLLSLGLGSNGQLLNIGYENNNRWAYDYADTRHVSGFMLGGNAITMQDWDSNATYENHGSGSTYAILPDILNEDPDGNGGFSDVDGDNFFDDIAVGDSVVFEYDFEITPRGEDGAMCGQGQSDFMSWEHRMFNALTKDQCGVERAPVGADLGYMNIIRDYSNPTLFEQDTDATDDMPFEMAISPYLYGSFTHNDHAMLNANVDNDMTITFTIPDGVVLDANSPLAANFTVVDANTITYTSDNIVSGYSPLEFADRYVRLPLVPDCDAGAPSPINISYRTTYKWYDGANVCMERDIHCGNFLPVALHGCNPCEGPNITAFDSHRITPGWTDNTMTTLVDLDSGNFELDKYLAGDIMRVEAEGFMNTLSADNLFFRQKYSTDGATLGANDIEFVEGTVYFHDASTGMDTAVQELTAPTIESVGNDHTAVFDMSNFIADLGGAVEHEDQFFVVMDWQFKADTYYNFGYHIMGFRGEFFVNAPNHPNADENGQVSCDDWGDSVGYMRPHSAPSSSDTSFKNCETPWTLTYNMYTRAGAGHLHPGEYRPVSAMQQVNVTLPDGLIIIDAYQRTNQGTYYVSGGDLAMQQTGANTYTFTPQNNYRHHDQVSTDSSGQFRMQIQGNCMLEESAIQVDTEVLHLAYGPNLPVTYERASQANYTAPTFIVQAQTSIVTPGYGPEADFDLNVVNTSTGAVAFNWIKVPESGLTVTTAYDITAGEPGTELNVIHEGADTYVEIGSLQATEDKDIRIKATYDICEDQDIVFEMGWDCNDYPNNYESMTAACYNYSTTMTLVPADAQVQQSVIEQPAGVITNCEAFEMVLQYNSAQTGTVVAPVTTIEPLGGSASLDVNLVEVEYPAGSGNWEDVTALLVTTQEGYTVPVEHSAMTPEYGGLPGTGTVGVQPIENRMANIRLTLQTTCEYISNSPIAFVINGDRSCGDPVLGDGAKLYTEGVEVDGLVSPYDAFSALIAPDEIDGCATTTTITAQTTFIDKDEQPALSTGTSDYGKITLPEGVHYVNGTFASTGVNEVTLVTATPQELIIQYPEGLVNNDTTEFTFDIEPTNGICTDAGSFVFNNYIEQDGIACGIDTCETGLIYTGATEETLNIRKPQTVSTAASEAVLTETVSSNGYFVASITLDNTGEVDMAAGYAYNFYCADSNGNPMGEIIYTGNLTQAIPAGGSVTEEIAFNGNSVCDTENGIVFVMEPNDTNCMCDAMQMQMALTITPIQAMPDVFTTQQGVGVVANLFEDQTGGEDILGTGNTEVTSYTQPENGTVTVTPDGTMTYTPNPGFSGVDTFEYCITDDENNESCTTVTITIPATPVAMDDEDLDNDAGPVTIADITADNGYGPDTADEVSGATIDPATVSFVGGEDTNQDGFNDTLVVPGEGIWTVTPEGAVTFTPEDGFTADPTPVNYTVNDDAGATSNEATITITYVALPPVAENDEDLDNVTGTAVAVDVLADNGFGMDADPDGTVDPTTVSLVAPAGAINIIVDPNGDVTGFDVPGEGNWSVNPETGEVTFTPEDGFTANPTPVNYTIEDNDGNESNEATITITYIAQPPVADNDEDLGNTPGDDVTLDILGNDNDPDGTLDPNSVVLTGSDPEIPYVLVVPGEGTWTYNPETGEVTFSPEDGFTADPTPITYIVSDNDGNPSNEATITVDYVPVTNDDESFDNVTNTPVTLPVLENDTDGDLVDPTTVSFVGGEDTNGDGFNDTLVVQGEGTWTVDDEGNVTFTPEDGFTGNPTPVDYTVEDEEGNVSNPSTITITYMSQPPVAIDDEDLDNEVGTAVGVDVVGNDSDPDGTVDPTTVSLVVPAGATSIIVDPNGDVTGFNVPGEGNWSVNPFTGEVIFTPEEGFTGDPTPVNYTIEDNDGNESNEATITITYLCDLVPPTSPEVAPLFCAGDTATLGDLVVDNTPDGAEVVWYDAFGNELSLSTVLVDGGTYFAGFAETDSACVSDVEDRLEFTVTINPIPEDPNGATLQEFCTLDAGTLTLADLQVTSDGEELVLNYYDTLTDYNNGNSIPDTTLLTDLNGLVIISQSYAEGGCESIDLLTVEIVFIPAANPGVDGTVTVECDGVNLFDSLGADAQEGGTWSPTLASGTGMFDPAVDVGGEYTYTIEGDAPCGDVSATVTVTNNWPTADCDNDGLTNADEIIAGTDPTNPDTDGDGVLDGTEVNVDGTNPLDNCSLVVTSQTVDPNEDWNNTDCDDDGLTNAEEVDPANGSVTDPLNPDSDGDGVLDGIEVEDGTNPLDNCDLLYNHQTEIPDAAWDAADCDGDGVPNGQEVIDGTNPLDSCDYLVPSQTETPDATWDAADCDGDGIPNGLEAPIDTDGDGIYDVFDTDDDGDGIDTADEDIDGDGDPTNDDTDGDGIPNYLDIDDDNDGILSELEGAIDSDGDGFLDYLDQDSDNDGIPDNVEGQPTEGYTPPTGNDSDGDGLDDAYDNSDDGVAGSDGIAVEDSDSDGTPDYLDLDTDNDGVFDSDESGLILTGTDNNNNGMDDGVEIVDGVLPDGYSDPNGIVNNTFDDLLNTDEAPLPDDVNFRDTDDDNDGILTGNEPSVEDPFGDCDNDGTVNYLDPDSCNFIPNAFSPGSGTDNNEWIIPAVATSPYFTLEIYDRWGNLVHEYDNAGRSFEEIEWWKGISNGRLNYQDGEILPTGTYFYIINFNKELEEPKTGWVYLSK